MRRDALSLATLMLVASCSSPSPTPTPPPSAAGEAPPSSAASPSPASTTTATAAAEEPSDDVVLAHHGDIEACAATAHEGIASLAGTVEVRWSVANTGAVSEVTLVTSTIEAGPGVSGGEPARALEGCIVAAIGDWTYPPIAAAHTATVHHTFTIGAAPGSTPASLDHLGHGAGTGSSGPAFGADASMARVRLGEATVSPGLAPEVVRRILRRHLNEVRFCYEREWQQSPTLAGTITVHFGIDAAGETTTPAIASSTMEAPGTPSGGELANRVRACLVTAVDRWGFPQPENAPVTVDTAFVFGGEPAVVEGAPTGGHDGTIGMGTRGVVGS